jgi:diaminohydroxyphosphoribosylaminopyrimidine deaminase/5-amino-6-(5-phosphoribosylamino)uracil reductase
MRYLAELEVNELQVECGPKLAGALLRAGLVDELVLYLAPTLLGADAQPLALLSSVASMAERMEFAICDLQRVGPDLRITLQPAQG